LWDATKAPPRRIIINNIIINININIININININIINININNIIINTNIINSIININNINDINIINTSSGSFNSPNINQPSIIYMSPNRGLWMR
jgi:hypothetical protein